MDLAEWGKLKPELEKLAPPLRIKKYIEILEALDRDSEIFDEVLELIEKASVEESLVIEKEEQELESLAEEERRQETERLEELLPKPDLEESLEENPMYFASKNKLETDTENSEKYKTFENLEIHEPEFASEEDFYKASDLFKRKIGKEEKRY